MNDRMSAMGHFKQHVIRYRGEPTAKQTGHATGRLSNEIAGQEVVCFSPATRSAGCRWRESLSFRPVVRMLSVAGSCRLTASSGGC